MPDINVNALSEAINDKLDRDMDNLLVESTESKNIANWSSNVTNCITEIPQDIKLELNNGTLTLKAGSKAYYPDGFEQDGTTKKFSTITTSSDIVLTDLPTSTTPDMLFLSINTMTLPGWPTTIIYSGDTDPLSGDTTTLWAFWYDTANNIFKTRENSATWATRHYTLPLGVDIGNGTDAIVAIKQVFNGFGYLGSTKFILPGVKGLIPNGRNEDGTLNNLSLNIASVKLVTGTSTANAIGVIGNNIHTNYEPDKFFYDDELNYNICNGNQVLAVPYTYPYYQASGVINNNIRFKKVSHLTDYSEADFVVAYQRPTAQNNYTWYRLYKSGWVEQGGKDFRHGYITITFPITMMDTNYSVVLTEYYQSTSGIDNSRNDNVITSNANTSTSSMYCYINDNTNIGVYWEVKGFVA